jgi:hypothetical protein
MRDRRQVCAATTVSASSCVVTMPPAGRRGLSGRFLLRSLLVGRDVVRVEIGPALRDPEEIAVEEEDEEQDNAKHGLDDAAAPREPAANRPERTQHEVDGNADAASDRLEHPGEERHDGIEPSGHEGIMQGRHSMPAVLKRLDQPLQIVELERRP